MSELPYLWLILACYGTAVWILLANIQRQQLLAWPARLNYLLLLAVALAAIAITQRWLRTGQGPFLTLFDVLLSNIFSLGLLLALTYWLLPTVRSAAIIAVPLLTLMTAWALSTSPASIPLPPTFEHPWLWIHVLAGKFFLGTCMLAFSLALILLLYRRTSIALVQINVLDGWIWRFLAIAFIFQSLMLVAGAVWASDAWGRYWGWDPLEIWSLLTWLALAVLLHARVTLRLPHRLAWAGVISVFVLAFLTFFGLPFINSTPHQGII